MRVQPLMSSVVDTSDESQYNGEKAILEVLIEFWPSFC
ncbi:transcriptional regulator, TraR/DksA family [Alicyclobacillus hesperidum URH17-3-68]|nr:transcriptional regulator, TraR/DksA family [Alicyclobacillus hesperidum URH17-3-68]